MTALTAMGQSPTSTREAARLWAPKVDDLSAQPLANFERARFVMKEAGVDAIVAATPLNSFYFSGVTPITSKMGYPLTAITIVPRESDRPVTLITGAGELWRMSQLKTWRPDAVIPVTMPDTQTQEPVPAAMGFTGLPERYSETDQRVADIFKRYGNDSQASFGAALSKALKDLGLANASIAVDTAVVRELVEAAGLEGVSCRAGDNLIRRIRMVKTARELHLMQEAGQRNAAAAHAAIAQFEPGMWTSDVQRLFFTEAAKRDMVPVFLLAGSLYGLPEEQVLEGTSLLVDAVSHYKGYHGDYGRTFVLGEAPKGLTAKSKKLQIAWDGAFEAIRPGVRYSEVQEAAREAVRRSNLGEQIDVVNPHSVGLQHTDEPSADDAPGFAKVDHVLEEGMTITVDLPHVEPGWGACHLEDLVVVTKDGAKPLHSMENPVVEV